MPLILAVSATGLMALIVMQLIWMRHSWQLSEQIFSQRVSMALCSSIESYQDGTWCAGDKCTIRNKTQGLGMKEAAILPVNMVDKPEFRSVLDKSLMFYQIDLNYVLNLSAEKKCGPDSYQTTVFLPELGGKEAYLGISFPDKQKFLLGGMNLMVLTSALILVFITVVLLFVNWALVKQRRLLKTNVDFFNNMAHEFRTPLSNIRLAVSMLVRKNEGLKDNPLVEVVRLENTRLLEEVERVLHLAKTESGDYALEKEVIDLKGLLQSALKSLTLVVADRGATITLEEIPEDLQVSGDRQHLCNVFRNLLDNALKYTRELPLIRIFARPEAQGVVIVIQDNGIGIPLAQREMIFEKFQRVHQGNQHDRKGFGLGLAYVKNMIELHKGSVRVLSEENRGSRFEVYLPTV